MAAVNLTANFLKNARGFTFADGGGVTWSFNQATNTLSASVSGGGAWPINTGWGAPVGGVIINNYNITDAGGANSNTNKCVAEIIAVLKAAGIIGA